MSEYHDPCCVRIFTEVSACLLIIQGLRGYMFQALFTIVVIIVFLLYKKRHHGILIYGSNTLLKLRHCRDSHIYFPALV